MAAMALPIIQGLGGLFGGIFGGQSAASAARQAAGIEAGTFGQNSNQLIGVGRQQLGYENALTNPYIQGGQQGFNTLAGLLKTPGQGLLQGYNAPLPQFQQPTGVTEQNDPGYQFRLQQGEQALQNSAAASGNLLSGNTLRALNQYGQDYASNEYSNVYNRALQNFGAQMQTYGAGANTFYQNQANQFNRLAGTAGMGLNAAQLQQQARENYGNLYANAMGMSNLAGVARAGGVLGSNQAALGGALGGLGAGMSGLGQLLTMPWGQTAQPATSGYGAQPGGSPFGLMSGPPPAAAYGLGSSTTGGGWGIGGYGQGFPGYPYNQTGY